MRVLAPPGTQQSPSRTPRGAAFLPYGHRAAPQLPSETKGKEILSVIRKWEQKKQMT